MLRILRSFYFLLKNFDCIRNMSIHTVMNCLLYSWVALVTVVNGTWVVLMTVTNSCRCLSIYTIFLDLHFLILEESVRVLISLCVVDLGVYISPFPC